MCQAPPMWGMSVRRVLWILHVFCEHVVAVLGGGSSILVGGCCGGAWGGGGGGGVRYGTDFARSLSRL